MYKNLKISKKKLIAFSALIIITLSVFLTAGAVSDKIKKFLPPKASGPTYTSTGSLDVGKSEWQLATDKKLVNLNGLLPIITNSFYVDYNYKTDKFRVSLYPDYSVSKQNFLNWLTQNNFAGLPNDYFEFVAATPPSSSQKTIFPTTDTYVDGSNPTVTYEKSASLYVDASPEKVSYLKFDLTPYSGVNLQSVKLFFKTTGSSYSGSPNDAKIHLVPDPNWPSSMTHSNKAAFTNLLSTVKTPASDTVHEAEIDTGTVKPYLGKLFSVAVVPTGSDAMYFYSMESGNFIPQLEIKYLSSSLSPTPTGSVLTVSPTPTLTPSPTTAPTAPSLPTNTPTPTPVSSGLPLTLIPTDDAFTSADRSTDNYGSISKLEVDGRPVKLTYLKFNLSGLSGKTISKAVLRLRITNSSGSTQNIKLTSNSWSENSITHTNRPLPGAIVASFSKSSSGTWKEIDITSFVNSFKGQVVSLAIDSTGSDGLDFYSKEAQESYRPNIYVQ